MKFLESFALDLLPQLPCFSPARLQRSIEHFERGDETPPILLLLRRDGTYEVYDGMSRINAARQRGITHLPAGICHSVAEVTSERMKMGKRFHEYWAEKRTQCA